MSLVPKVIAAVAAATVVTATLLVPSGSAPVDAAVAGCAACPADAVAVAGGYTLNVDGTVWTWGANAPAQIPGLADVEQIAASTKTAYALVNGEVWAWGDNRNGELGNGSFGGSTATPAKVTGLTDITAIAAGANTRYALRDDGTVWSWGRNNRAQLGGLAEGRSAKPVRIAGVRGAVKIAGGADSGWAVLADGTALAWGANDRGQLGSGEISQREAIPVPVAAIP